MKKYALIAAGFLMGTTMIAYAGSDGIYVGGTLGSSQVKASASEQHLSPAKTDDNGFAWGVFAGYELNANFAIELDYTDYANVDFKNVKGVSGANSSFDEQALALNGRLIFPIGAGFDIYAMGGLAYVIGERDPNSLAKSIGASTNTSHAVRPTYGVGADFNFYPGWSVLVDWNQVTSGGGIPTSNFLSGGLAYTFG